MRGKGRPIARGGCVGAAAAAQVASACESFRSSPSPRGAAPSSWEATGGACGAEGYLGSAGGCVGARTAEGAVK